MVKDGLFLHAKQYINKQHYEHECRKCCKNVGLNELSKSNKFFLILK